ncbi:MAG: hypothetical protein GY749_38430, partial [Desulfobacteraceae bacterium]|nr:hypothetical protein [Desulfobacteraceae bacterium]
NSRELKEEELDMPMSYGLGAAYRFSDIFTVSGDVYKTHWEDFIARDSEGNESSLLTSKPVNESDIDSIYHVRVGTEYLFKNIEKRYVIPLRAGIFYDPAPAEGSPNDYYGFSIGSGIAIGRCVFDIAYQHRFANNIDSLIPTQYPKLSHDVDEHMIYSSLIIHL